jgi:NADH-quinone oxidoreductase subunit N
VLFYLLAYLLGSFAVFAVMTHVAGADDSDQELDHYVNLAKKNPLLAGALAVGLGSLAGIPPFAGFMGKLFIFIAAFKAGLYWLLAIAIGGVIMSIYYYFGWIKAAFFTTPSAPQPESETASAPLTPVGVAVGVALLVLVIGSVLLGFCPGALGAWVLAR